MVSIEDIRPPCVWMREHGGGAGMSVRNNTAQELGVSRDEIEVSLKTWSRPNLQRSRDQRGGMIVH
jgi:hypothetical protein